jgi:MYXO-CTERM domain-containing protein
MWLGLVPGVSLDPVQPEPPKWAGNADSTGSGESSSTSAGAGGSDSSTSGAGAADSSNGFNSEGGCTYASGSRGNTTPTFFALALAGLFLGRRRRKEVA